MRRRAFPPMMDLTLAALLGAAATIAMVLWLRDGGKLPGVIAGALGLLGACLVTLVNGLRNRTVVKIEAAFDSEKYKNRVSQYSREMEKEFDLKAPFYRINALYHAFTVCTVLSFIATPGALLYPPVYAVVAFVTAAAVALGVAFAIRVIGVESDIAHQEYDDFQAKVTRDRQSTQ